MLFSQHQSSFGFTPQLTPVQNGIANWDRIWRYMWSITPLLTTKFTDINTMWKRIGFFRYSPEYNQLADKLLRSLVNFHANPITNQDPFGISNTTQPSGLDQYDKTSMAQVNNLIQFFQTFSF